MASALFDYLSEGCCSECFHLLRSRIERLEASGMRLKLPADLTEKAPYLSTPEKQEEGVSRPKATPPSSVSSTRTHNYGSALKKGLSSTGSESRERRWAGTPDSRGEGGSSLARPSPPTSAGSYGYGSTGSKGSSSNGGGFGEQESDDLVETADTDEWKEWGRVSKVGRKKDFRLVERIKGKEVNILQGLELHTNVFNSREREKIVNLIYRMQRQGREGRLRERTYSEPRKWMRGKGRVTLQFGCCYNYAVDKDGNPPGILREEEVDPLPPLFKVMIKRLVRWHVLPPSCVPNSCIVNIYDEGDCIPPHIDHHDFMRPFCTISFLAECNILFGYDIDIEGPGEFHAPVAIPLPVGSVFILNGNGADVAKHCVPGVPAKRISITFRKMKPEKIPYSYTPDAKLQGLMPLTRPPTTSPPQATSASQSHVMTNDRAQRTTHLPETMPSSHHMVTPYSQAQKQQPEKTRRTNSLEDDDKCNGISMLTLKNDDFPPLDGSSSNHKRRDRHAR